MKADINTKRFILCPGCGQHEHSVEHLFLSAPRTFGPWSCETDDCLIRISGKVSVDGTIDLETDVMKRPRGFALCKLRDLYLVLRQPYGRIENPDYFYHSHQCPTNLLRYVVDVYAPSGEADVHGMIRFVAAIDDTPETRKVLREHGGQNLSLRKVMELFETDGEPIETDWPESNEGVIPFVAELRREHKERS